MQENTRVKRLIAVSGLGLVLALTAPARSATTTITERPGSYSRDTTVTKANGQTATYQNYASWGNGSYTDTRSYTGRNGGTRTDTVTRSGWRCHEHIYWKERELANRQPSWPDIAVTGVSVPDARGSVAQQQQSRDRQGALWPPADSYSSRNAIIGSTRVPLRAGM